MIVIVKLPNLGSRIFSLVLFFFLIFLFYSAGLRGASKLDNKVVCQSCSRAVEALLFLLFFFFFSFLNLVMGSWVVYGWIMLLKAGMIVV